MSRHEGFSTRFEFVVGDYAFEVCRNGMVFVRYNVRLLDDGTKTSNVRGFSDLCDAVMAVLPCKVPS